MLEEVMRYVNNRFDRNGDGFYYGSIYGTFTVADGTLEADGLSEGQYFWVEGSTFNDGLHYYHDGDMRDEVFKGRIVKLVVPSSFVNLADEIASWLETYSKEIGGPYESESFGGYTYKLAEGGVQGNESPATAWQVKFGARLRPYRKLSRDWV